MLRSKSYADATFLAMYFEHLDEMIYRDPGRALAWAKIAPELAQRASKGAGQTGLRIHREQLVMANAILGGAYRACGMPDEAGIPYAHALKAMKAGAVSSVVRARVERRLSFLRCWQGRYDEALELAEGAVAALRKIDSDDEPNIALRLGCALISYGYALIDGFGRHQEAIDAFGEAILLAGAAKSPAHQRLHTAGALNLAYVIAVSRSFEGHSRALGYLNKARTHLKGQRRNAARYRILWVEGLIWSKTGSHAKAEKLFLLALEGFTALEMPYEIALVGLDLGAVHALLGHWDELQELAAQTVRVFQLHAGSTPVYAALSQWLKAVRAQTLEEKLCEETRQMVLAKASRSCSVKRR